MYLDRAASRIVLNCKGDTGFSEGSGEDKVLVTLCQVARYGVNAIERTSITCFLKFARRKTDRRCCLPLKA
jgi:hypothetical protein